ncbi:MAG: hypothetical protein NC218_08145 [Acetobacter sp.]|nr:hypothetical protein [Acetobacter sp.]
MGERIYEINIKGEDYFHCDEDGYIMVFDSPEQILAWARDNNIDPDDITYFEDEVLDEDQLTFNDEAE